MLNVSVVAPALSTDANIASIAVISASAALRTRILAIVGTFGAASHSAPAAAV